MRLTPAILRASYDFLRITEPFCRWKLPASDIIKFEVTRSRGVHGDHRLMPNWQHRIRASGELHGHTETLLLTIAHEIVHLRQVERGTCSAKTDHNAEFWRLWNNVCRHHGFDPKL